PQDEVRRVSVRWVDGFLLTAVGNENAGYLANTLPDGAQNIYLALSTNDNNTLDKSNKIVPADPQQNQVRLQESAVSGGLFTYYV
ncbi:type 3 fimbria minor subunit MrkF, partial [Escherichia coli]|nr:type 3 fimbria minor subunit MrkF [Escherichia coli]